jgi:hypothetical protein
MGFLKIYPGVEAWLRSSSAEFRSFSQKEYAALVRRWRSSFEPTRVANECRRGNSAEEAAERKLPCDVFVFSLPGYRLLPASTDARFDPAYAYAAVDFGKLDLETANRADAIIVNQSLTFTFLCTHEAGGFSRPVFCELRSRM